MFSREEKKLKEIFNDELVNVFHIGSTSIPTIGYAKPIIDILIVVKNIEAVDKFNEKMRDLGYEPKGENGIPARRYFPKGNENRTHHVHIFQVGNENINTHLNFKEYLLQHPIEAQSYGELKVKLLTQFPDAHHKYQTGKQDYVNRLVEKAEKWAINKSPN